MTKLVLIPFLILTTNSFAGTNPCAETIATYEKIIEKSVNGVIASTLSNKSSRMSNREDQNEEDARTYKALVRKIQINALNVQVEYMTASAAMKKCLSESAIQQ